ncbi:hypothetical protein P154DRAFT_228693 [Amniculicola lignicola CBS 123094]|uniref:Uncharacterized protein n=1 Tax=Amniculicola lignicola CBS 123094 TaxID=1392246 RepID=A0A6A5WD02_9PLEO|nr:hypothetical protein P154DRAFT_228693 [Amniculicola lignicola CBS 123094]
MQAFFFGGSTWEAAIARSRPGLSGFQRYRSCAFGAAIGTLWVPVDDTGIHPVVLVLNVNGLGRSFRNCDGGYRNR